MKRISKEQYKHKKRKLKEKYKKAHKLLKVDYRNSGDDCNDVLNSIYIRKIYYGITYHNLKRDGFLKFFWGKFLAERRYLYYTSINRPAKLECDKWYWPQVSFNTKLMDIEYLTRNVLVGLDECGNELVKRYEERERRLEAIKEKSKNNG